MLLIVCPNLGLDRILEVEDFHAAKVQRSRSVLVQPGGKGSNVARLGGEAVLTGFVGRSKTCAERALRMATAAAVSDVTTLRPGFVDPSHVRKLMREVVLECV